MAEKSDDDFAWSKCHDKTPHTRVCLKQQAVDDAFKYSEELCHELKCALNQVGDRQKNAFDLMGGNEIRAWMKQLDDLKKKNDQLEILVGVAGATGAGKTSLLNALLEIPELLPSSSQEAATATVCRVSYNTDKTSGNEFKAEVIFRSKEDAIKELIDVLRAIQERKDLYKQEFEDEQERIEAVNEMTEIIAKSISHVCAAWDLDEGDLEEEEYTAVSIIERHLDIWMTLGTTKYIHSSDCGDFAMQVKPYLDSTQTPEGMTAWPLIKEVRLFVKSDILKRGIVLVDLPGLSDASEGRSRVAEENFQKLRLTIIVSPAIRAADEKTAVSLMSNYQETRMKLDGRYHKESFCVVMSKIDDIDCEAFCGASREALKDRQLQADRKEIKSLEAEVNSTRKEMADIQKNYDAATRKIVRLKDKVDWAKTKYQSDKTTHGNHKKVKLQSKVAGWRNKRKVTMKKRDQITTQKKRASAELVEQIRSLENLQGRKMHRCVWIRSAYIKKRIQTDFAKRQKKFARVAKRDQRYDGTVEVFPVCAAALRALLRENTAPMPGFPSKVYTGIPRLRQWVGEATLSYREAHLDSILLTLRRLFKTISRWSQDNSKGLVAFSRQDVEKLLETAHEKYQNKLVMALDRGIDHIKHLSPIPNKAQKIRSSKSIAIQCANRWAYKFPENMNSAKKMSWATYQAVLKRGGGPYQSFSSGHLTYDFPMSLAMPFLYSLIEDWLSFFQDQLPKTVDSAIGKIVEIWGQYMKEVRYQIEYTAPKVLPYFADTGLSIATIAAEMRDQIKRAINGVSSDSAQVHPLFLDAVRQHTLPLFESALEIAGKGQFNKRQLYLRSEIEAKCLRIFGAGCDRMEAEFKRRTAKLSHTLEWIVDQAVYAVKTDIGLLLCNLQAVTAKDRTEVLSKKMQLQRSIKTSTLVWGAQWRSPEQDDAWVNVEDVDIPKEFDPHALDGTDDEDNGTGGSDSSDSDSDSDSGSGSYHANLEHQDQEMDDF